MQLWKTSIITKHGTATGKASHLSATEFKEDINVVLIFKMMRKLNNMFVLEGFVQLNFICYLKENHKMAEVSIKIDKQFIISMKADMIINRSLITLSLWCGLDTLLCGITFTAYILLLERSVIS